MRYCNRLDYSLFVLLVSLALSLFTSTEIVAAQSDSFVLEVEQHWDTYGVGGTCIAGTHNLAVADVDSDGSSEMITGGFSYGEVNGNRTSFGAPLRIWSWNGQNLTLEKSENWPGSIWCVYAGDADGDGEVEVLTVGGLSDVTGTVSSLRLWNWNGQSLFLRGSYAGISASSIFVQDVDKDSKPEILSVGRASNMSQPNAQLNVWQWDGTVLSLKARTEWSAESDIARANSVNAADLDDDGKVEIVTCGYVNSPKNSSGQVCVWQSGGTDLSLKASVEWRKVDGYGLDVAGNVMGNTMAYNVKVGDVDDDGFPEVVTGGFTYNGNKIEGELRVWNWTGKALNLESGQEWMTSDLTELKSISINDVNSDGREEIVTGGVTTKYGNWTDATNKVTAELRVWSLNGRTLALEQSTDWIVGEGVCAWNCGTGDVDNDGVVEMITVGCMYVGTLCDPDLRIWSLPVDSNSSASFPYFSVAIAGTAAVSVMVAAYLFVRKKR